MTWYVVVMVMMVTVVTVVMVVMVMMYASSSTTTIARMTSHLCVTSYDIISSNYIHVLHTLTLVFP